MKRILFVHNSPQRFVRLDRELLSKRYRVTELRETRRTRVRPLRVARLAACHDLVFCWFASWHSLLPVLVARLAAKPSMVIVGGYDTADVPEARYGSQRGGLRRLISRSVMRNATRLVAFSRSARREAISNAGIPPHKVSMIYLGLPASERDVSSNRERLALTVGGVWEENLLRKGLLPFVEAAAHLPHVQFLLVGRWYDDSIDVLRQAAGPNVKFSGFVPDDRLSAIYGRSSVYVQASLHEGFGMSVAEAMLAGCVPVVTDRGSLPEIVGDIGVYASSNEPRAVAEGIRHALSMNGGARHKAQERVLTHFPLERRRKALYDLIDQIVRETE